MSSCEAHMECQFKKEQNSRLMCVAVTVDSTILTFYLQCRCAFYSYVTGIIGLINLCNMVTAPTFVLKFFCIFFSPTSIGDLENRNRNSV